MHFLRGGGLAFGLSAVAAGWPGLVARALAAGEGLTPGRQATLRTLIAALAEVPRTLVRENKADAALAQFREWYETAPRETRARVDALLDVLEQADGGSRLSARSHSDVRKFLSSWVGARTAQETALEAKMGATVDGQPRAQGGGDTFKTFVEEQSRAIQEHDRRLRREHGDAALDLDPETGLSPYLPPDNPDELRFDPPPANSPASRKRLVAGAALHLAGAYFYPEGGVPPVAAAGPSERSDQ